ncbi:hypothetical protein SAMN04488059_107165 [Devosia psychrophila]|uniref:Uncharacterized protein n=1 Tax=Devosia psychrophila TaxID=728005 RepID=A0A1I1KII3_9HYPH|nr:hypothetical protein SAMN04488059_107165 [Devosia psychrophila]
MLDMGSHSAPTRPTPARPSLLYNLACIAVFVLLLAVGAAYLIDELGRAESVPVPTLADSNPVFQTISGRELAIPRSWFRYGEQIRGGFTDQIDLRIMILPDGAQHAVSMDVTLLPPSRARSSATLLDRVYLHQFAGETLRGVPGLVGKPMQPQDGYAGENVWYDALSPNPFVAKCQQPVAGRAAAQCVRTAYLPSGIAAIYTFDVALLQSWRQIDPKIQLWLEPIGAW